MPWLPAPPARPRLDRRQRHRQPRVRGPVRSSAGRSRGGLGASRLRAGLPRPPAEPGPRRRPGRCHPPRSPTSCRTSSRSTGRPSWCRLRPTTSTTATRRWAAASNRPWRRCPPTPAGGCGASGATSRRPTSSTASTTRCSTARCTCSTPTPASSSATTTGRSYGPRHGQRGHGLRARLRLRFAGGDASSPTPSVITEVRLLDGRFMASEPHHLDQGPEPAAIYDVDLTPWLDSPSVHELVGYIREVREDPVAVTALDTLHAAAGRGLPPRRVRRGARPVVGRRTAAGTGRRWTTAVAGRSRHDTRGAGGEVALRAELHPVPEPVGGPPRRAAADLPSRAWRETAARLLGVDAVRLWHDQALYKEPGGRETDPHQDHPYWPIVETNTITAWIPFDGSTLESGAMGYLPGSHRLGLREFVNIFTGDRVTTRWRGGSWPGSSRCSSRCRAGAVAFHHGLTFHLAAAQRHRYGPSGAHRHLLRRRVAPGARALPAPVGRAGGDRARRRDRQRRHAARLAAGRRRPAAGAGGAAAYPEACAAARHASRPSSSGVVGRARLLPDRRVRPGVDVRGDAGAGSPRSCATRRWRQSLGVKVMPESNKAGVAVDAPRGRGVEDLQAAPRPGVRRVRPLCRCGRPGRRVDRARHRRLPVAVHLQDVGRLGPALAPGLLLFPLRAGPARGGRLAGRDRGHAGQRMPARAARLADRAGAHARPRPPARRQLRLLRDRRPRHGARRSRS